ncbi:MAG: STAS-like domain-containing protein [Planktomarina sp.]
MVTIKVNALVSSCVTNDDGKVVSKAIRQGLDACDSVTLDFFGIDTVSTSFVNSSIIVLLDDFDVEAIKGRMLITRASKQIGNMIKMRVSSESLLHTNV